MDSIFRKNELGFALMWIGIYCIGMSVSDSVSRSVGTEHSVSALFALAAGLFLFRWIGKNGLKEYFGLCRTSASAKAFLFFVPLVLITSKNLWTGVSLNYTSAELVFFIVKMLCVGFLEEIIFRGFLFRAMSRNSIRPAVIVSSLTFGFGHIINLLNGSGMSPADNIVQIILAVCMGFLYVIIFYRGGSLIPCIVSHGLFNSLSAFSNDSVSGMQLTVSRAALIVLVARYSLILLKTLPERGKQEN